jgi:hypothetical protein
VKKWGLEGGGGSVCIFEKQEGTGISKNLKQKSLGSLVFANQKQITETQHTSGNT